MKTKSLFTTTFLLIISVLSFDLPARETPDGKIFIKSLLEAEYSGAMEDGIELNLTQEPYSVTLGEEDDRYSVSFTVIAHEDLNDDGIDDYVIYRKSEGMLGGNANTNSQYIFYIMKDEGEIDHSYEILGYAPFSYNIINEAEYKDKHLFVDIQQNFRTYYNDGEELEKTALNFTYKNGNLYEESYLTDCEMAKMKDKRIFKSDIANVERELNIDMHNYTEISSEKYISGDTVVAAWLGGCDNLAMGFSTDIKLSPNAKPTFGLYKKTVLDFISFLMDNTRYNTLMKKIYDSYIQTEYKENESKEYSFDNTWKCTVSKFDHDQSSNTLRIFMYMENVVNENQADNWDITIRKKE